MRAEAEKLSIIIPTYNESKTIIQVLDRILSIPLYGIRNSSLITKELIIVDDCSTDDTEEKIAEFVKQHPSALIKYTKLGKNQGKGYAVRTGIGLSTGEIIIIQDADLEYNPADYSNLLPHILSGEYKIVYGSRLLNKNNKYSYRTFYWGGRFVSFITGLLFGIRITDEPTCYKMFDASVLKSISLTSNRFGFCPEVTAKVLKRGYLIKEVPISYSPRSKKEGKKIKWRDGIEAVYLLFKYRFTKN